MTSKIPRRLVIGISGASGTIYGVRMLEMLKKTDIETHLVMSKSAEMTLVYETKFKPKDVRALASVNHPAADIGASISSGSLAEMGAVVAPIVPAFYNKPKSVDDIINHTVGRLLDLLGIETKLVKRWEG